MKPAIGILGGTFDPVHYGHLRLAVELRDQLRLGEIRLIPSAQPPHREEPVASPGQRAKWIRQSVVNEPGLWLDDRELLRSGPSYTVDTLRSLRSDMPETPLCLIMGSDVFSSFDRWHEWQQIIEIAHLVVAPRPAAKIRISAELQAVVAERSTERVDDLHEKLGGCYFSGQLPPLSISGTEIREQIANGRSGRYLMPDAVWREICEERIYQLSKPAA